MTNLATPELVHYRACWDGNEVQQVLETLTLLAERVSNHELALRKDQRSTYVAPVFVGYKFQGRKELTKAILPVLGRDLSRSGMGMLTPVLFEPQDLDQDNNTLLRAANVFRDGEVLDIGLQKSDGEWLWVYGTCMRVCVVQHDFLDVGIRFNGRRNLALDFDFI